MTPPTLSIDYGTSNTVAVLRRADGQVRPLLFDGSPLLPSGVYVGSAETVPLEFLAQPLWKELPPDDLDTFASDDPDGEERQRARRLADDRLPDFGGPKGSLDSKAMVMLGIAVVFFVALVCAGFVFNGRPRPTRAKAQADRVCQP